MRISYYCKSCKKKNYINTKANDRFELKEEMGTDEIDSRCDHCGSIEKRHLNRFDAEMKRWVLPTAVILCLIATMVLFSIGLIATVTFTAPIYLYFQAQKDVNRFNRTKLRRR